MEFRMQENQIDQDVVTTTELDQLVIEASELLLVAGGEFTDAAC